MLTICLLGVLSIFVISRLKNLWWFPVKKLLRSESAIRATLGIVLQADGAEGLNSILDLTVNLYLYLEPVLESWLEY